MEKVYFLPVEILLKICQDSSDSMDEQGFFPPQQNGEINEYVHYFKLHLLPVLKIALSSLLTEIMAKDVLFVCEFQIIRISKYRSALNSIEYLVLKLYVNNPMKINERHSVKQLKDIPWAAEFYEENPRRMLPLNYYLTRSDSATIIQKHWRGYLIRKREDVQELRQWQREWRIQLQNNHGSADLIQSVPSANIINNR
ncbi:unnamed protein product [Hymenolepis diminuta]|uniref:IQ domain-containing protein K n=1 Tax=Hymenolepis diminuta TaxID=6216 RepID=A0A564ZBB9_HYMDI|nr:unnamed protein product [Hymenolepis diminuta]